MTMKKALIGYMIVLHLLIGFRVWQKVNPYVTPAESTPYYIAMLESHRRTDSKVPPGSILFFGDSLILGLPVHAITPLAVNYGIGGDTTEWLLKRLHEYGSTSKAGGVVLAIGINDLKLRDDDSIINNYRAILSSLPNHIPVLISAILPVDETGILVKKGFKVRISTLNKRLRKLCEESPRFSFCDPSSSLYGSDLTLNPSLHTGDGLHLTPDGYVIWGEAIKKALRPQQNPTA